MSHRELLCELGKTEGSLFELRKELFLQRNAEKNLKHFFCPNLFQLSKNLCKLLKTFETFSGKLCKNMDPRLNPN